MLKVNHIAMVRTNRNQFIRFLLYLYIISIFSSDWLYFVFNIGSRQIAWTPEFVSLILFLYIPATMALTKEWRLPPKYTILLFIYITHIIIGLAVNSVSFGPMIVGLRQFCRFIPIFVLPAVIQFDENEVQKLLKFIFALALLQFPVTLWQRFFLYAHDPSGDPIGGTLGANTSGVLSVFLLMVLSFLTAYYLKEGLSLGHFIPLCLIIFIPTTLNETKVTLPLLPFALLLPVIFANKSKYRFNSRIFHLFFILAVTIFLFISIYNSFGRRDIIIFYSHEDHAGSYSEKRIIPIMTAVRKVFDGGLKTIIYGYGAGNLSVSFSKSLQSSNIQEFSNYNPDNVSITKLLWETGYIGTLLFFILLAVTFLDFVKYSKNDFFIGAIALGMAAATVIFFISFFYTRPLSHNIFPYIYFFFSGYLITHKRFVK